MPGHPELTDMTFAEQVLQAKNPILVEFWAERCRSSEAVRGELEALVAAWGGGLEWHRINADANPVATLLYGARELPLVLLFWGGEERGRWVGAVDRTELERALRAAWGEERRSASQ